MPGGRVVSSIASVVCQYPFNARRRPVQEGSSSRRGLPGDHYTMRLNGNGSRQALRTPRTEPGGGSHAAAGNKLERVIAAIWRDVLGLDRVGLRDNFFDLGGHSLLMTRVHEELESRLGRSLPVVALFQYPTVQALAGHLSGTVGAPSGLGEVRVRAARQRAGLLAMQRAMDGKAGRGEEPI